MEKVEEVVIEDRMHKCRIYSKEIPVGPSGSTAMRCSGKEIRRALYPVPYSESEPGSFSSILGMDDSLGSIASVEACPMADLDEDLIEDIETAADDIKLVNPEVGLNPLERNPHLKALIQKDAESPHSFILEATTAERSTFIFIPNGNEEEALRIVVAYAETGKPVGNPRDLKRMVLCYCALYDSAKENWDQEHVPDIAAKLGCITYRAKYTLMVVKFSSQTVLVFTDPRRMRGFGNFAGTKLRISPAARERIRSIYEKSREDDQRGASGGPEHSPSDDDRG